MRPFLIIAAIYIKALFKIMNNEFTRMQKLAGIITEGYTDAKRADNAHDLGKSGEENLYGAGVEKGEEIEKKKLTKEEAKKMIKDAILAEMSHDDDPRDELADPHNLPGGQYLDEAFPDAMNRMDSLVDQNAKFTLVKTVRSIIRDLKMEDFEDDDIFDYIMDLVKTLPDAEGSYYDADKEQNDDTVPVPTDEDGLPLGEAKKDEEEEEDEVEIEDEETVEEPAADEDMIDADMEGGMDMDAGSDEAKTAFDELTDAYRSAKELGDEKLIRQLANTITYFNKNIILK